MSAKRVVEDSERLIRADEVRRHRNAPHRSMRLCVKASAAGRRAIGLQLSGARKFAAPLVRQGDAKGAADLYAATARSVLREPAAPAAAADRLRAALALSALTEDAAASAKLLRDALDAAEAALLAAEDGGGGATAAAGSAPVEMDAGAEVEMLFDFTREDASEQASAWFSVHDNVMGGRSGGALRVGADCEAAVFEGELRPDNGGGFASVRARTPGLDVSRYDGIVVEARCARGTEAEWLLLLKDSAAVAQQVTFKRHVRVGTEWERVYVRFEELTAEFRGRPAVRPPLDLSDVQEVGFMVKRGANPFGPFSLQLRKVGAWRRA